MHLRIVGIKRYTDRHGKLRVYWRRKGAPAVALDPDLTNAQLAEEVARLERQHVAPAARAGTLRLLIAEYKRDSNHWRRLRARTRKDYERVFTWLGAAVDVPASTITTVSIASVRDKARDQHEPKFANQVVTCLKMVFRFGLERGHVRENPCLGLEKATGGRKRPNRPVTPDEATALLLAAPRAFLPVLALGLYCGIREGDIAALPRNCIEGDWIGFEQGKTRRWHFAYMGEDLRRILADMALHDAITLLASSRGTPWTTEGIKSAIKRLTDELEAAGRISPGVTFHGLRHTGATWLEEAGFEENQTKHYLGHGPKTVSGRYGQSANRKKLVGEMGRVIENVIREAQGNVVRIGNGSV